MEGLTINRANLKFHKFRYLGNKKWTKIYADTFCFVLIDISSDKPHISIECMNDSIHVTNCVTIKDLFDLERLFGVYN